MERNSRGIAASGLWDFKCKQLSDRNASTTLVRRFSLSISIELCRSLRFSGGVVIVQSTYIKLDVVPKVY